MSTNDNNTNNKKRAHDAAGTLSSTQESQKRPRVSLSPQTVKTDSKHEPSSKEVEVKLETYRKKRRECNERLQTRYQQIGQAATARSINLVLITDYERPAVSKPQNPTNQEMVDFIEKASQMLDDEAQVLFAQCDSAMAAMNDNDPPVGPNLIPDWS